MNKKLAILTLISLLNAQSTWTMEKADAAFNARVDALMAQAKALNNKAQAMKNVLADQAQAKELKTLDDTDGDWVLLGQ